MKKGKDGAKNFYLKFVDLLRLENSTDRAAFKETMDEFAKDIKNMGEYIKNNEGKKKVLANNEQKN